MAASESSYGKDAEHESIMFSQSVPGGFVVSATGMNMATSPPETPHHARGGPHWGFEVADDMTHTPGYGSLPSEFQIQMPQPQYVSPSMPSQPATPGVNYFGGVPSSYPLHSPQFDITDPPATEYRFPDSNVYYSMGNSVQSSPEQQKQHNFVFHNSSVDDFEAKSTSATPPSLSSA